MGFVRSSVVTRPKAQKEGRIPELFVTTSPSVTDTEVLQSNMGLVILSVSAYSMAVYPLAKS